MHRALLQVCAELTQQTHWTLELMWLLRCYGLWDLLRVLIIISSTAMPVGAGGAVAVVKQQHLR
jgi:hypothetical protein